MGLNLEASEILKSSGQSASPERNIVRWRDPDSVSLSMPGLTPTHRAHYDTSATPLAAASLTTLIRLLEPTPTDDDPVY